MMSALLLLAASCSDDGASGGAQDAATGQDTAGEEDAARDAAEGDVELDALPDAPEDVAVDVAQDTEPDLGPIIDDPRVYGFAGGCYTIEAQAPNSDTSAFLTATEEGFAFSADTASEASRFHMRASDLGTYLLYDAEARYVVASEPGEPLTREAELLSDVMLLDDDYLPGAQWALEGSVRDPERFQLRHLKSGGYLTATGLGSRLHDAALLTLSEATGCADHPELSLDARGEVEPRQFEDGAVFGFAEPHTHIMSNFGFGGGGIFHGAAFHPLGVQHALPSCEPFHGAEGRQDLLGYGFGRRQDFANLLEALVTGELPEPDHATAGWPEFTDWPNGPDSPTHQTQYYMWIKRAWMSGLRLLVQHGTSNQTICELIVGSNIQQVRYSCNDMVAIDRGIDETWRMERYIDAQNGGPGEGWFRVVTSPAEAREVINQGKLAVVLGIEVSNLFNCVLTPPEGEARCDEGDILEALDTYHEKGVRAIFPVHKYDNVFSPGDGHRGIFEAANFIQTGHWSDFTQEDCPTRGPGFDRGGLEFANLNEPRDMYLADAPADVSAFVEDPIDALLTYADRLLPESADGDWCKKGNLTPQGDFLIRELMRRGMIIEVDHLPRRSYVEAMAMLEANDYPPVGTHGNNDGGRVYALGGISTSRFSRCANPNRPGSRGDNRRSRVALSVEQGGYPAEPFSYDLNGFAGAPDGRFGEDGCGREQTDPVLYPFTSYAGDVTFTEPRLGERAVDYNTEGLVHIGMFPELIEDIRHDVGDEELEPLFRSAEAYLRMWEKAERRGAALSEDE
ncbi:MAG: hypothetical protein CMH57_12005 [Myxococcales bacterium]|nr:hypothetical protein [Myxococcales bacterium]